MRAVFLGTPEEAVPILAALLALCDDVSVVTRPDRPKGRGLQVQPSPVTEAAEAWGLTLSKPASADELRAPLEGADVAVVAAYGRLIPEALLTVPKAGMLNVHFSLLPRWRGASPATRAILAGDETTGVTLMVVDAGLDTGPMVAQDSVRIRRSDTGGTLTARLAGLGADLIIRHLDAFVTGDLQPQPQDDTAATAAAKVTSDEAFIDPSRHSAVSIERAVRAFNPRPGAWATVDGRRLRVLAAHHDDQEAEPGVAHLVDDQVVLGASDGALRLITVQPEGKPPMDATAWMHGRRGEAAGFTRPDA